MKTAILEKFKSKIKILSTIISSVGNVKLPTLLWRQTHAYKCGHQEEGLASTQYNR